VKVETFLKNNLLLIIILLGAFSLFMLREPIRPGHCSGNVIVVPDHYPKISWAVGNASEGDTILVRSGNYSESQITVNKTLTITGENAENTIIDGGETTQFIFHVIANNVVIENVTLQNTSSTTIPPSSAVSLLNDTNVTLERIAFKSVGCAVGMRFSNFTRILNSKISNATIGAQFRDNSYNNTIAGNTLENNSIAVSILGSTCSYNRIFHNNFINNTNQVSNFGSFNFFDDGYPSGGNLWSDHYGDDLYSGPYQNETGSDGILDEAYPFKEAPLDRYPFSYPLTEIEVTAGGSSFFLDISTNSTLIDYFLNDSAKSMNLMIQSHPSNNGSCRIKIPKGLLSCNSLSEWNVSEIYLNGTTLELTYRAMIDSENTYIYFAYTQSHISQIEIRGTIFLSEVSITVIAIVFILFSVILLFEKRLLKRGKSKALFE
jgi:hypothetical protein